MTSFGFLPTEVLIVTTVTRAGVPLSPPGYLDLMNCIITVCVSVCVRFISFCQENRVLSCFLFSYILNAFCSPCTSIFVVNVSETVQLSSLAAPAPTSCCAFSATSNSFIIIKCYLQHENRPQMARKSSYKWVRFHLINAMNPHLKC